MSRSLRKHAVFECAGTVNLSILPVCRASVPKKKVPVRSSKPGGDSLFQSVISSAGSLKALRQAPARRAPPLQELGRFQWLQRGPLRRPPHQEFDQQDRRPQVELSQHLTYQRLLLRAISRPQMSLFAGSRRHPACHCATDVSPVSKGGLV